MSALESRDEVRTHRAYNRRLMTASSAGRT